MEMNLLVFWFNYVDSIFFGAVNFFFNPDFFFLKNSFRFIINEQKAQKFPYTSFPHLPHSFPFTIVPTRGYICMTDEPHWHTIIA